jgi:hypothetical protein
MELTRAIEKTKWENRKDEATSLLLESILTDLWFHVSSCKNLNKIWTTLEGLFRNKDEMRGHMLEVELKTLDPKSFDNIQDLFTKFKSLILSLESYGIDKSKQVDQLILTILAKLGPKYAVYVSIFHSGRYLLGSKWKIPTMEQFVDSLTHEQEKLIQMGLIKEPKAHVLTMQDGKGSSDKKSKQKGKEKHK